MRSFPLVSARFRSLSRSCSWPNIGLCNAGMMNNNNYKKLLTTLALCAIASGCAVDGDTFDTEMAEEEVNEIVANLIAAGYPDAEIEVTENGQVIVGGDAVVTLEASQEIAGADAVNAEGFRQYRTTNLVSIGAICIDGSAFTGDMSTGLDRAIANFNDQLLDFTIKRNSGSTTNCDAVITANVVDGFKGLAGFPSGGDPYDTFDIGDDVASPKRSETDATFVATG